MMQPYLPSLLSVKHLYSLKFRESAAHSYAYEFIYDFWLSFGFQSHLLSSLDLNATVALSIWFSLSRQVEIDFSICW